jgi:UDP-glucose 4-epimerase
MILVTGGLGFIGSHTARSLLDLGDSCLLTSRRMGLVADFLADEIGKRLFVAQADVTSKGALLDVCKQHEISGIIHLSAAMPQADVLQTVDAHVQGLLNVFHVAQTMDLARVCVASTIGVYAGVRQTLLREDDPLPTTVHDPIPLLKRCSELIGSLTNIDQHFEVVNMRISTIWGPGRAQNEVPFSSIPAIVHGRTSDSPIDRVAQSRLYADDARDICYVKDCARAIALLQLANKLNHRTYNVGHGQATSNKDIVAALQESLPEASVDVIAGRDPTGPGHDTYLDLARIRTDTGYAPTFNVERGVRDYINWLQAGHPY